VPWIERNRRSLGDCVGTRVGDIVLRKDETAAGQTYKYARIISVHVGSDGRVRSADVEYKVPGEF
jgi:hypothetical protein